MKRFALLFMLLCLTACAAQTASGGQLAAANQLYKAGQYDDAIAAYRALLDADVRDGRVYYNLGNAYFQTGDIGRAILNYRRAEQLLPRDGDVTTNLKLARTRTVDQIQHSNGGVLVEFVRNLYSWLTLDQAALVIVVLWVLLCVLAGLAILYPVRRRLLVYASVPLALLFVLGLLAVGGRLYDERRHPPAVVVAQEIDIHSGPGEDYVNEFTLHAGTEVRIVERRGGWLRIALPGGLQGWAPESAVDAI